MKKKTQKHFKGTEKEKEDRKLKGKFQCDSQLRKLKKKDLFLNGMCFY